MQRRKNEQNCINVYLRSPGGIRTRRCSLLVSLPIPCSSSLDIFFPLLAVWAAVRRAIQAWLLLMFERRVVRLLRTVRLFHVRMMTRMSGAHHTVYQVTPLLCTLGGGRITATPHNHASTTRHPLFTETNNFFWLKHALKTRRIIINNTTCYYYCNCRVDRNIKLKRKEASL